MKTLPRKKLDLRKCFCYLATPYSHYPFGTEAAFHDAARLVARLLCMGIKAYSPIAHTHPVALYGGLDPLDHGIWIPFDQEMMRRCDVLIVAKLPEWHRSAGILHEMEFFQKAGKPIYYLNVETMGVKKLSQAA